MMPHLRVTIWANISLCRAGCRPQIVRARDQISKIVTEVSDSANTYNISSGFWGNPGKITLAQDGPGSV